MVKESDFDKSIESLKEIKPERDLSKLPYFIAYGTAIVFYICLCIFPLAFNIFAKWDGSYVIGFHLNAIYVFVAGSVLYYLHTCWKQDKKLMTVLVSIYSIIISIGY